MLARRLPQGAYERRIGKGLSGAYKRMTTVRTVELSQLRAVVFSDHHRGTGDGADDFRRCEEAYAAALGWYLESGYELWLLGDVEELWENRASDVLARYDDILELERAFGDRLVRVYGNHDMSWRHPATFRSELAPHLPGTPMREAIRLRLVDGNVPVGSMFLVHGHQGTLDSGNLLVVPFARFAVRFGWATLQRLFGFANTSPATNAVLRSKHDRAMATWADRHPDRIMLVAGHTHHPVFPGTMPPDREAEARNREADWNVAQQSGRDLPAARAARELARARALRMVRHEPIDRERSGYFNTGCCSFGDGDVTGLEFADGAVRLVRWLDDNGEPVAHELGRAKLSSLLGALTGQAPQAP